MQARNRPYHTLKEYDQWEGDWELDDGVPVAISPSPRRGHQEMVVEVVSRLREQLRGNDACRCEAYIEIDWRRRPSSALRPDLFVVCPKLTTDYLEVTPQLIVEVLSPATRYRDENVKRKIYEERGVGHYVMVDPDDGTVVALSQDASGWAFRDADRAGDGFVFDLHDGCRVMLPPKIVLA